MDAALQVLIQIGEYLRIACEIGILAFLVYMALLFVRGTRAVTILAGIAIVFITMSVLSQLLALEVIEWILMKMWTFLALSVLIIFHPEIRRAFAQIGSQQRLLRLHGASKREKELINNLLDATYYLADHRIGALFAIERDIGMRAFAETGTYIGAPVTSDLLSTIFFPNTPLHDGGVIIRDDRILAAGCIFPLTQNPDLSRSLGTRHRAGAGITEETDAIAIVISEETGAVSLAHRGRLIRGVKRKRLERHLTNYLVRKRTAPQRKGLRAGLAELQAEIADDAEAEEKTVSL